MSNSTFRNSRSKKRSPLDHSVNSDRLILKTRGILKPLSENGPAISVREQLCCTETGTRTRCVGVCTYCLARNVESKVSWVTESPLRPGGSIGCRLARMRLAKSNTIIIIIIITVPAVDRLRAVERSLGTADCEHRVQPPMNSLQKGHLPKFPLYVRLEIFRRFFVSEVFTYGIEREREKERSRRYWTQEEMSGGKIELFEDHRLCIIDYYFKN